MLIIGLTGGIGSGKTTVANLFAEYGVPIIDADVIARDITTPEGAAYKPLVAHFGESILQADRTLNRAALRQLVFKHPKERIWLENLLHPLIRQTIHDQIQALKAPYCLVVIPLLVETGAYPFINRILVVDSPEASQTERVMLRDKTSAADINAIINTQASRNARLSKADDIISNTGSLGDLIPQVEKLHHLYLKG